MNSDIDSHLLSVICSCSQEDATLYVEPCSRHYFYHHIDDDHYHYYLQNSLVIVSVAVCMSVCLYVI